MHYTYEGLSPDTPRDVHNKYTEMLERCNATFGANEINAATGASGELVYASQLGTVVLSEEDAGDFESEIGRLFKGTVIREEGVTKYKMSVIHLGEAHGSKVGKESITLRTDVKRKHIKGLNLDNETIDYWLAVLEEASEAGFDPFEAHILVEAEGAKDAQRVSAGLARQALLGLPDPGSEA